MRIKLSALLAVFAFLILLSVLAVQPSTARPVAVETLALEPTLGTIPPVQYRMWLLPVAGSPGDTE